MGGPSIVGYGYYNNISESGRKNEALLIGFSLRKKYIVLYVLNNFKGQQKLLDKLGQHTTGKICLYINTLSDVNFEILEEIVAAAFNKVKHKNEIHP